MPEENNQNPESVSTETANGQPGSPDNQAAAAAPAETPAPETKISLEDDLAQLDKLNDRELSVIEATVNGLCMAKEPEE